MSMTTLTKKEKALIGILKTMKVNKAATLHIMDIVYTKTEEKMDALVKYIKHNQQATPEEIKTKAIEIADTL